MRPRYLLKILRFSKTSAINRQHSRIEEDDLLRGIEDFSNELVMETAQEIRDVIPEAGEVIYAFLGERSIMSKDAIISLFPSPCSEPVIAGRLFDLLLWFGFIGLYRNQDYTVYIYDSLAGYSLTKIKALAGKAAGALFRINPAFEPGLALTRG
jgi:hypothetical protein